MKFIPAPATDVYTLFVYALISTTHPATKHRRDRHKTQVQEGAPDLLKFHPGGVDLK